MGSQTGYDLADLARRTKDVGYIQATLARAENRGKTFDELWEERLSFVRTDLADLAGALNSDVPLDKEAVRKGLIARCRLLGVDTATLMRGERLDPDLALELLGRRVLAVCETDEYLRVRDFLGDGIWLIPRGSKIPQLQFDVLIRTPRGYGIRDSWEIVLESFVSQEARRITLVPVPR